MKCGTCEKFETGKTCYDEYGNILRQNVAVIDIACHCYEEDKWKIRQENIIFAVNGGWHG